MKLYLECNMGAAGDMLMGALLELLPDRELFLQRMRGLGLPGVEIGCERVTKCGIAGTKVHVLVGGVEEGPAGSGGHGHILREDEQAHRHTHGYASESGGEQEHEHIQEHEHMHAHEHIHEHEHTHGHDGTGDSGHTHTHYGYSDIRALIGGLELAENVKTDALEVYRLIGEAESAAHSVPLEEIRFHEVGSLDAVTDIVGCCLLFHMLGADRVDASPVHVGSGFVRTAHGILPVPAPATAHILRGVPIYGGLIKGELCTPTGAALLRHFVTRFGDMEPMAVSRIGYGMGTRDFEAANCVRAYLSEHTHSVETVVELECNLDDMTPEAVGYATRLLMESGALDVYTTPVTMKKNRPAVLLTCLCAPDDKDDLSRLILQHTTTLGLRYQTKRRDVLGHTVYRVATKYGDIRVKSAAGYGITKEKPEYEDVAKAADAHGVPFEKVWTAAVRQMKSNKQETMP